MTVANKQFNFDFYRHNNDVFSEFSIETTTAPHQFEQKIESFFFVHFQFPRHHWFKWCVTHVWPMHDAKWCDNVINNTYKCAKMNGHITQWSKSKSKAKSNQIKWNRIVALHSNLFINLSNELQANSLMYSCITRIGPIEIFFFFCIIWQKKGTVCICACVYTFDFIYAVDGRTHTHTSKSVLI